MPVGPVLSRLSLSQLHELTGRDRRWIKQRLADAELKPSEEDKRTRYYPARAALTAIYDRAAVDLSAEQARLARERADAQAISNAQRREELVPGEDLDQMLIGLWTAASLGMQGIGAQLGPELASESAATECQRIVDEAIRERLSDIAEAGRRAAEKAGEEIPQALH